MNELLETLRNTDTHMSIDPDDLGICITFLHMNAGDPVKFSFLISDIDLADMWQVFDVEKYIMAKLEFFLGELRIKVTA